jgi:hypothetical protein
MPGCILLCTQGISGNPQQRSQLLQLPESALELVLHKLNLNSLASTAVTCSQLSHAVPASITKLVVSFKTQQQLQSFVAWLQRHGNSITQCNLKGVGHYLYGLIQLKQLPCPQLRQLSIEDLQVHLDLTQFFPGVLHDCTALTALHLQRCQIWDTPAAHAAIAALPELRSLSMTRSGNLGARWHLLGQLPLSTKLTKLELDMLRVENELYQQLSQLSALVSLEELRLRKLRPVGLPGCLPSQLQKLRRLHLAYRYIEFDVTEQFQHLSSLTALQDITFKSDDDLLSGRRGAGLGGMQQLSRLTRLDLSCPLQDFSTASTNSWAHRLTALERLSVSCCAIQPEALGAFTQLRVLSVSGARVTAPLDELLLAASKLSQLTMLCIVGPRCTAVPQEPLPATAASTALAFSTNLCSLQLGLVDACAPGGCDLFRPGVVYPHLRLIDLQHEAPFPPMRISGQQLQQLCSSCPAVESLAFASRSEFTHAAFSPLLQLSALTSLELRNPRAAAAPAAAGAVDVAAAAAVDVAAQLTGLKQLSLIDLPHLTDSALQLTALTALTEITLGFPKGPWVPPRLGQPSCSQWHLRNEVCSASWVTDTQCGG